jgi:capsular polysaccharide transport system permease protein
MSTTTTAAPHLRVIELTPSDSIGDLTVPGGEPYFIEEPRPSWLRRWALFIITMVIPIGIGGGYYAFIASDQYASEASFYVRAISSDNSTGMLSLFSQPGQMSRSNDDTYALNEYLRSRDMVDLLVKEDGLRDVFSRPGVDFLSRFPKFYARDDRENLYKHFRQYVSVEVDGASGISTLQVRLFTPQDSQRIASALLRHGEALINELNARARNDSIKVAQAEVDRVTRSLERLQGEMTEYRNRELVLDPVRQSQAVLEGITKLSTEVARQQALLAQTLAQTPNSPQIPSLRERVKALQNQVDQQRLQIVGGDKSIASKLAEFEKLSLEREMGVKSLASALVSLENARRDAQKQQLFLDTITKPHLADEATYPKRLLMILLIAGVSFSIFWIMRTALKVLEAHKA